MEHIAYQQWGDPQASRQIIILHGWGMNSGVWADIAGKLLECCPQLHIIAPDLPGYGESSNYDFDVMDGHYNAAGLAQSLAFLVKKQSIVLGWSMGGLVAIEMCQAFPQLISQLILVSSTPRFIQGENWEYAIKASIFEEFYRYLEQDHLATLKRFMAIQAMGSQTARNDIKTLQVQLLKRGDAAPIALKYGLKMLLNEDKRRQLSSITQIPVALIAGQRDTLVNIKAQEQLAQQDNIKLYPIAHAAHAPFISQPQIFMNILREIIEH